MARRCAIQVSDDCFQLFELVVGLELCVESEEAISAIRLRHLQ